MEHVFKFFPCPLISFHLKFEFSLKHPLIDWVYLVCEVKLLDPLSRSIKHRLFIHQNKMNLQLTVVVHDAPWDVPTLVLSDPSR
jgi:hypothetical protein